MQLAFRVAFPACKGSPFQGGLGDLRVGNAPSPSTPHPSPLRAFLSPATSLEQQNPYSHNPPPPPTPAMSTMNLLSFRKAILSLLGRD